MEAARLVTPCVREPEIYMCRKKYITYHKQHTRTINTNRPMKAQKKGLYNYLEAANFLILASKTLPSPPHAWAMGHGVGRWVFEARIKQVAALK